jgi:hypothetical protein
VYDDFDVSFLKVIIFNCKSNFNPEILHVPSFFPVILDIISELEKVLNSIVTIGFYSKTINGEKNGNTQKK